MRNPQTRTSIPSDPLAAAQGFIGGAISIGAPAYNTGDRQGCFDVYACIARMILATVPGLAAEPTAKLRQALDRCAQLVDPDQPAWAMRHAFDVIGEMGEASSGLTLGEIRGLLARAISIGAPAFNLEALSGASVIPSVTRQAWVLREAFDTILGLRQAAPEPDR